MCLMGAVQLDLAGAPAGPDHATPSVAIDI